MDQVESAPAEIEFTDETVRPGSGGRCVVSGGVVESQDDYARRVGLLLDAQGCFKTTHFRHDKIHEDNMGLQFRNAFDRLATRGQRRDDLDSGIGSEKLGGGFEKQGIVIHEEDADGVGTGVLAPCYISEMMKPIGTAGTDAH